MGGQGVRVYTDDMNFLYVFPLMALQVAVVLHVLAKVQHWAVYLSQFRFYIAYVNGTNDVFADILRRWSRGYRVGILLTQNICSMTYEEAQLTPSAADIEWLDLKTPHNTQKKNCEKPRTPKKDSFEGLCKIDGIIWIPEGHVS